MFFYVFYLFFSWILSFSVFLQLSKDRGGTYSVSGRNIRAGVIAPPQEDYSEVVGGRIADESASGFWIPGNLTVVRVMSILGSGRLKQRMRYIGASSSTCSWHVMRFNCFCGFEMDAEVVPSVLCGLRDSGGIGGGLSDVGS